MRRLAPLIGALAFSVSASILTASPVAASAAIAHPRGSCEAIAHHEDASHSGNSCTELAKPRVKKWSVTLAGAASYPLIADGLVFVTTANSDLYALHETTGKVAWGPIPLSGALSITYDGGKVFVNNFDGNVTAFNGSTGQQLWSQTTNYFSGELVAYKGVLYVQDAGPVFALSEQTGAVRWISGYLDGDQSSVSVDDTGVYVAAGCSWFRLSLSTGSVLWSGNSGCFGGGGGTTYLSQGRDFVNPNFGSPIIVSKATGHQLGSFTGTPAFSGENGYFVTGTTVFCENILTLKPIFSKSLPSAAVTSPVIAGSVLYVAASNSRVYGVSTTTGKVIWSAGLTGAPTSDIAVGEGILVVPTGNVLTAFR